MPTCEGFTTQTYLRDNHSMRLTTLVVESAQPKDQEKQQTSPVPHRPPSSHTALMLVVYSVRGCCLVTALEGWVHSLGTPLAKESWTGYQAGYTWRMFLLPWWSASPTPRKSTTSLLERSLPHRMCSYRHTTRRYGTPILVPRRPRPSPWGYSTSIAPILVLPQPLRYVWWPSNSKRVDNGQIHCYNID